MSEEGLILVEIDRDMWEVGLGQGRRGMGEVALSHNPPLLDRYTDWFADCELHLCRDMWEVWLGQGTVGGEDCFVS